MLALQGLPQRDDLKETIGNLRSQFENQQIILEEFLDGRDFTVAILGTNSSAVVLGVLEVPWYNQKGHKNALVDFATAFSKACRGPDQDMGYIHADMVDPLVKQVANVALSAYQLLGCRNGARVDIL